MSFLAQRRGALAALTVGVAVVALYVVLQPGERPQGAASVSSTSSTVAVTTTRPPIDELCDLARAFEQESAGQDAVVTARLGEMFYARASEFAPADARPEYEAAARYYAEYNTIGEQYEYDFWKIMGSPDAQRWTVLLFREPLGVGTARANLAFLCQVAVPPPPTVTTTTTTRPRATTVAPTDGATTVPGATTAPGDTTAPGSSPPDATPPPATPAPATAAPG